MIIVLTGIDGSGKSTAARSLVQAVRARGGKALLLSNHAGRRTMSIMAAACGVRIPGRLADAVESAVRTANVLVSHLRASRFDGLVVMDRHLHCQLGLRSAKGLPRGRFLPWLLAALPRPAAVVHLDLDPAEAHRRITARGTDAETLADLVAFRDGYAALPGFGAFIRVDASLPAAELARRLMQAVDGLPATLPHSAPGTSGEPSVTNGN
ncbi:dTMP kinase [Pseudarthrobacter enclensis]|uniref:Thymidylate kinase n=1 Tax=Pseudarthrobacter enclensis TaxID=993070 RepID=A0A0V8IPP3_9MICC|nr:thymidylate kinase [Pseudarthrobacter enclensis]KSU76722.1 thymidylate kinase [Pseudarthrobacter enclensis]SCC01628.1 dTMP kinase [Pseudarthrobacter enclensis]